MIDALVTAAGRLSAADAKRFGSDIKALVPIGNRTLLTICIEALRGVRDVDRIVVVGSHNARAAAPDVDIWIDEQRTGEDNVTAALEAARSDRVVFCASDMPFVSSSAIDDLLARTPAGPDCAYPIFTRAEFQAAFPGGRSSFAALADGEWTGGSALALVPATLLRNVRLLRQAFAARKNLVALAGLLGPALALRYARHQLRVSDIKSRIESLIHGRVEIVRGADPGLAMDCDEAADFEYARTHVEQRTRADNERLV